MKFALAQLNPIIGDIKGNAGKIISASLSAADLGANVILTPELSLLGYPPKDLLLNPSIFDYEKEFLNTIADKIYQKDNQISLLVGIAEPTGDTHIPNLFNSIVLITKNKWEVVARKQLLPTYDIFDEKRYFRAYNDSSVIEIKLRERKHRLGITICEDLWVEESIQGKRLIGPDPIAKLKDQNIDHLINLSASPFVDSKVSLRQKIAAKAASRLNCNVIYVNQVGGNDELIFDGSSFIIDNQGAIEKKLPSFQESIAIWEPSSKKKLQAIEGSDRYEKLFQALVLGVKDYARKCHFKSALIGLSGGIDSALVTTIATAALGADKVHTILMPSPWSSADSINDSIALANRLKISTTEIPISSLMDCFDAVLTNSTGESPQGITAENLQSRIRGTILMALANQNKHLLLSTGNKSELAVGYCTLYGDMNGGLSVIGDLYKTSVFELSEWIDSERSSTCRKLFSLAENSEIIGTKIRTKAPSAELRPNQLDTDSLPNYSVLDPILKSLIEDHLSVKSLIKAGHNPELVIKVANLLKQSEFKRNQAPPLLKVSNQAFGTGWRRPIAS